MNLSFIGTGYVGLVSATAFAEMGNQVTCVDIDPAKVARLKSGKPTIYEPGLEDLFERNIRENRLHFTCNLQEAVQNSTFIFLTLPTPPQEDGSADLSYVMNVVSQLADMIRDTYRVIITKSTVPVGTASKLHNLLESKGLRAGQHFDVVSNPEFLREGSAIQDFMKPERVVIGTSSPAAGELMKSLYEPFVRNGNPILIMDERSAELVKYASNAFLATKISFINEIANLCTRVGADVERVRQGMGKDSRIGSQFLYAGLGYGGSCFPKDVQALAMTSESVDYPFEILEAVMRVNQHQRERMLDQICEAFPDLTGKKIAVWGAAFKPNTDDVREAPAIWLIQQLTDRGAVVACYDPEAMENAKRLVSSEVIWVTDPYEALNQADALLVATEWNEFRNPDWTKIKSKLLTQRIFDGRNVYDPRKMADMGFEYVSVGRPSIRPNLMLANSLRVAV
jgi:UDPglucose 6-dehydrogenase